MDSHGLPLTPIASDCHRLRRWQVRDSDLSKFILGLGLRAYRSSPSDQSHGGEAADDNSSGGGPVVLFHEVLGVLLHAAFGDVVAQMKSATTEAEVLQHVAESLQQKLGQKTKSMTASAAAPMLADAQQQKSLRKLSIREDTAVAHHYAVYVIQRRARARAKRRATAKALFSA